MPTRSQVQHAAPGVAASKTPRKPLLKGTDATSDGTETDPKGTKKIMADSGAFFVKPGPAKSKSA